jgi:hypothetical protein
MENQEKEAYGIENTKKVVAFVGDLAEASAEILADGKVTRGEVLLKGVPLALRSLSVFTTIQEVPKELNDLSDAERAELRKAVAEYFNLPNENAEKIGEQTIFVFLQIIGLGKLIAEARKKTT